MGGQNKRPVPEDFHVIGPTMTVRKLATYYRAGHHCVLRWIAETGIARVKGEPHNKVGLRPPPEDFAEHAAYSTSAELRMRYGAGHDAIKRWRKETATPAKMGPRPTRIRNANYFGKPKLIHVSDDSLTSQAAQFLRREYVPVCKCITSNSKADPDLWFVGRNVLSTADMIAKAESRGFGVRVAA